MGAAAYGWVQRFTAGCSRLLLGAAVYRRGGGLPPGAAIYRWMQTLIAEYGGLPLGAAAYRWVRRVTAGCSRLRLGDAAYFFPAA